MILFKNKFDFSVAGKDGDPLAMLIRIAVAMVMNKRVVKRTV